MTWRWTRKQPSQAINAIVERRVAGENVRFKHVLEDLRKASFWDCLRWSPLDVHCDKLHLGTRFSQMAQPQGLTMNHGWLSTEVNNLKLQKMTHKDFRPRTKLHCSCLRLEPLYPLWRTHKWKWRYHWVLWRTLVVCRNPQKEKPLSKIWDVSRTL